MRKLKLDLDTLAVETFDAHTGRESRRGTVRGHDSSWRDPSCMYECAGGGPYQTVEYLSCTPEHCW